MYVVECCGTCKIPKRSQPQKGMLRKDMTCDAEVFLHLSHHYALEFAISVCRSQTPNTVEGSMHIDITSTQGAFLSLKKFKEATFRLPSINLCEPPIDHRLLAISDRNRSQTLRSQKIQDLQKELFLVSDRHSIAIAWQAPKNTQKHNTPKNAENRPFNLRFRVCCVFGCVFGALLEGNKEHPKTQHTRERRFSERSVFCVFGCVAFSGGFLVEKGIFKPHLLPSFKLGKQAGMLRTKGESLKRHSQRVCV